MTVVDEIKAKIDIVDYIQRTVSLKRAGRSYKACCPFHSEKTPSFVVDPVRQSWRCFGSCQIGGDVFAFAMRQHGWTFREALEELGKLAGVEVEQATPEQKQRGEQLDRLRGLLSTLADYYHECLWEKRLLRGATAALNYARRKRALSDETLTRFRVGYAPEGWQNAVDYLTNLGYSAEDLLTAGVANQKDGTDRLYDRFRNRLMIPICDERGRVVGFGARALDPKDEPKYLNSPQTPLFDKSKLLFALDHAKQPIRESETVVIVEGYMDAIQAHQAGFTNVVAQMGTAMTEAQLKQIAPKWAKKIILALDADAAGQNATRRGLEVARQTLSEDYSGRLSVDIRILSIPGAKDPDDLIRETPAVWAGLVQNAVPVTTYLIDTETADLPPNASVQEREAVARGLLPLLLATESHLYQKDNLQKLALRLRLPERELLAWADEQQRLAAARQARPPAAAPAAPAPSAAPFENTPKTGYNTPILAPREAAAEAFCLRLLFQQPELYYHVNRKFRELAGEDSSLSRGPLADLCADDFSRSDYRALMLTFQAAMSQHEQEPLAFVRLQLPADLAQTVDVILAEEVEGVRSRLLHRQSADLAAAHKQLSRLTGVAGEEELIEKTLRLREQRLRQEVEDIVFLQIDAESSPDDAHSQMLTERVVLFSRAQQRIHAELKRQTMLSKQY